MATPQIFRYRAFLSYSHRNSRLARRVHRALETFKIDSDLVGRETEAGAVPKTLRPIFRDRHDFAAGLCLAQQTQEALAASRFLVVLCSPSAAKSDYVNEEIRAFVTLRRAAGLDDAVLPLIIDGIPGDPEKECFPPALRFEIDESGAITDRPATVLSADAREEGDGFDLALAKVVARLIGLKPDEVFRRAARERRRKERVRNAVIAALAVLLVVASGSGLWAFNALTQVENTLETTLEVTRAEMERFAERSLRRNVTAQEVQEQLADLGKVLAALEALPRRTPELDFRRARLKLEQARLHADVGQAEERRRLLTEAQAALALLARRRPNNRDYQREHAVALWELGVLAEDEGDDVEAGALYENGLALQKALSADHPNDIRVRRDLAIVLNSLAGVADRANDVPNAYKYYVASLELRAGLAADPSLTEWQSQRARRDLSIIQEYLGAFRLKHGAAAEALDLFEKARLLREDLAKERPGDARSQDDLAVIFAKRGGALLTLQGETPQGRAAAIEDFTRARDLLAPLIAADPDRVDWLRDLSEYERILGAVQEARGDVAATAAHYSRALELLAELRRRGDFQSKDVLVISEMRSWLKKNRI